MAKNTSRPESPAAGPPQGGRGPQPKQSAGHSGVWGQRTTRSGERGGVTLNAEVANRLADPFETLFMGVLRTNDPLLMERGSNGAAAYDIYRALKRDGKVFAGLQKRKLAVIGRPWQVEAIEGDAGNADAETVTALLKGCNFDAVCSDLMEALLYGFVPAEIVWTFKDGLVAPERVIAHRQRRFVYVQDDVNQPPQLRMLTRQDMIRGVALPERKFIVHRLNSEDDNPYGTGLGLQLFWPVYFKRAAVVSWNKLNDRFGTPTLVGKYPAGADPKAQGRLLDALRALSNDGAITVPEGMLVELLETRVSGNITTQQALVEYMDDWIAEVLLGQSPRQNNGGAQAAAANEREGVRMELSQADSDLLSETLNRTLVAWVCELNGLAPCQVYRVIKKDEDLKVASETDVNVASLGFRMTLDGARSRYGEYWEEAAAPTAQPVQPQPPGAPGNPFPLPRPGEGRSEGGNEGAPAASFAEPAQGAAPTAADLLAGQLASAGDTVLAHWMARIKAMVQAADSPERLRQNILAAYDQLPADELAKVIELALTAAELAGMYDAANEAGALPAPSVGN